MYVCVCSFIRTKAKQVDEDIVCITATRMILAMKLVSRIEIAVELFERFQPKKDGVYLIVCIAGACDAIVYENERGKTYEHTYTLCNIYLSVK